VRLAMLLTAIDVNKPIDKGDINVVGSSKRFLLSRWFGLDGSRRIQATPTQLRT
jgi:hypothetical protein